MSTPTTTTVAQPAFMTTLASRYYAGIAHAFVLHGNTTDHVAGTYNLYQYLSLQLAERIVVRFRRDTGMTFATPSMEDRFRELVDYDARQRGSNAAVLAAFAGKKGDTTANKKAPLPTEVAESLQYLNELLHVAPKWNADRSRNLNAALVIIDAAQTIVPNSPYTAMPPSDRDALVMLSNWGTDETINAAQHIIILVTPTLGDVHESIRSASNKWEPIELKLPDQDQRLAYIQMARQLYGPDWKFRWDVDEATLARRTESLARIHVLDILLRAAVEGGLTQEMIKDNKKRIVKAEFDDVLTIHDPEFGFEAVAGTAELKEFFRRFVIRPLQSGNPRGCPKGILLMGPPGTGKTLFLKSVAGEADVELFIINFAKIYGQYVGNSERNLEKMIAAIENKGGIVFIDELDQAMSRSTSGDAGVSSRVFSRFMGWMADDRLKGRVVFVAATNRPDLIDDAMKRAGRFGDKKIAVLPPEDDDRAAILAVHARRQQLDITGVSAEAIANTRDWSGADCATAIDIAVELVEFDNFNPDDALTEATRRYTPPIDSYKWMIKLALSEVNDTRWIPERYRTMAQELPSQAQELAQETVLRGKAPRGSLGI